MSDYSNTFNGALKDANNDVVLGAQIDTELDAIALASATKANKVIAATAGNIPTLQADGDIQDSGTTATTINDSAWPVGSVYFNTTATNPNTLLGFGTWVAVAEGRFLVGVGDNGDGKSYTNGDTGGSKDAVVVEHNHSITDPQHSHDITPPANSAPGASSSSDGPDDGTQVSSTDAASTGITIDNEGVSGIDQNLPPHFALHMWERTV